MFLTVDLPPGVVRTGTEYKSRGRFYDCNLWRWWGGTQQPVGGWKRYSQTAVDGAPRAMLSWADDTNGCWAAIGTHTGLWVMSRSGAVHSVLPASPSPPFSAGRVDGSGGAGYGALAYNTGLYGKPRPSAFDIIPASVWSLDNWGRMLVGVMGEDGRIWQWDPNTPTASAVTVGAPKAKALVVTGERIMMALGAEDDPRRIDTSDQGDNTVWTETATNYVTTFNLPTAGKIVTARRVNGGTLIFTDVDVWLASFVGQPLVYGYEKRGSGCGAISPGGVAVTDAGAFWMGGNGFWSYNGFTAPLVCDVQDYVFSGINPLQVSKVTAVHNSAFGEVWWFYCSASAKENDRYVVYNYREKHWSIGALGRLSGTDRGVFANPMMMGSDNYVYGHEIGFDHGGLAPYATTGPFELASGDQLMQVQRIVPDAQTLGAVGVSFTARDYPASGAIVKGPYALSGKTDVRFTARSVEMTLTGADNSDFRVGSFRLDSRTMGGR